ncbi:hypothetical protein BO70DRAFT_421019 [Aspergillus heteromorphus CBS 117.55]|uniref:Rhodopsin domain-containing protein n=1 Tax=Aspergillus heteromorphus CBS 117.55 TaxID=1448321 RepID=A0A317WMZ5_9EURO|nr:uncharacterized protein BO70DRAFT_421019 [Aspergillus heteromorphus CBS 117.55]PWY87405.1 hypothetical protein BO70DRAFT_421019 [Aspergillus heteromorphus CBS 117.55]
MTNILTDTTAKVKGPTFIGVIWGATILSFLFISARTAARLCTFRRLWLDDAFAIIAWLMLLASAIIWQSQLYHLYLIFQLSDGTMSMTPDIIAQIAQLGRAEIFFLVFFYSSLWTIKASFLVFFRRLGGTDRRWITWFWCVVGFALAAYCVVVGDIQWTCLVNIRAASMARCSTEKAILYQYDTLIINLALDVLTDLAIISLPIILLWNIQIPLRQKLILMAILSLAVVIIIVAIVRVAVVARKDSNSDESWLWMWSFIEATVANIVACVASFRQLFMKHDQKRSQPYPSYPPSTPRDARRSKQGGVERTWTPSQDSSDLEMCRYGSHRGLTASDHVAVE